LLASMIGVAPRTVYEWVKVGMPKHGAGRFDAVVCLAWWRENILSKDTDDETLTEAKRKYWQAKVANLEIRNAALRGEYVLQSDVCRSSAEIAARFRNACRSWRTRLPPVLVGKTVEEMLPAIESEIDAALSELASALEADGKPIQRRKRKPETKQDAAKVAGKRPRGRPRKASSG
jgi:phage terminase Nu1 subunit (DNA packaging protein)